MLRLSLLLVLLAGPAIAEVRFSGTVVADRLIDIRAARSGMIVAEVLVRSGDSVARGGLLARLRANEAREALAVAVATLARSEAEVVSARTDIAVAESDLRVAERQATRSDALGARGAVSAEVAEQRAEAQLRASAILDRARAALSVAEAAAAIARADLATARLHLADTEIRAPADGLILTRSAEVGTDAALLFTMAADEAMVVEAQILGPDFAKVQPGLPATIRLEDREVTGHVATVGGSIDPVTRTGIARIAIDAPAIAGAFASGEIAPLREARR